MNRSAEGPASATTIGPSPAIQPGSIVGLGDLVGGFRIMRLAGSGGMGVVFEAIDPELGRPVALKVIAPELAAIPKLRDLFVTEAQAAAAIEHPNVVPVYRAGDDAGRLFMAMRFVKGTTLRELLADGSRMAPGRAAHLVAQVAAALDAAHDAGLVHGDVKPANVLVTDSGGEEHAYLTDFGLSGLATLRGATGGTLGYLSPERVAGGSPDVASDIYALGCVLTECLTGDVHSAQAAELPGGLPVGVAELIAQATARVPDQRFDSAGALGRAALRLRHDTVVLADDQADASALADWLLSAGVRPWDGDGPVADALGASASCVVAVAGEGLGWARSHLAALQEVAAKDPGFRLIAALLPGAPEHHEASLKPLAGWPSVDLREAAPDDWGALVARAIRGGGSILPEASTDSETCPYLGLGAFSEETARHFVGREAEVERLLEILRAGHFVAVAGASGSGKSSLVHAGLVPAVRRGGIPGRSDWRIVSTTPGPHPLESLTSVCRTLASTTDVTAQSLLRSPTLFEEALGPGSIPVLLVVDQFEEIFTVCSSNAERTAAIDALVYAATVPGGALHLVLAMRADFYDRCASHPKLRALVNDHQLLVGPLAPGALRRIIEEPARQVGLALEPGLARAIIEDVGDRPGELPLVSHLLYELWRRRSGRLLTNEAYAASGGVEGAVGRRAEDVFSRFGDAERDIARRIMLRLVQPGEGTEDTRRRASLSELELDSVDGSLITLVLEALAEVRLLTLSRDQATGRPTAEIAHEALIRSWPRLRGWINEDRDALRAQQRLSHAADEWQRAGRDDDLLLRGARLAVAEERPQADSNPTEREFLAASTKRAKHEVAARRRRLRIAFASMASGLAAVAGLAGIVLVQRNSAASDRDSALSRQVAGSARDQLAVDPEQALLLAAVAYRTKPTPEAEQVLRQAIHDSKVRVTYVEHHAPLNDALFSSNGRWVATAGNDGAVRVWNPLDGATVAVLKGHDGPVRKVALQGGSSNLLSIGDDGTLRQWRLNDEGRLQGSEVLLRWTRSPLTALAVSLDGAKIAVGTRGGRIMLVDSTGGATTTRMPGGGEVHDLSFDTHGAVLVSAVGRRAEIWHVPGRGRPRTLAVGGLNNEISRVAVSPSGRTVLIANGPEAQVWRGGAVRALAGIGAEVQPAAFAFDRRSKKILVGLSSGEIRLLPSNPLDSAIRLLGQAGPISAARLSPDGRTALTASGDGTARIWAVHDGLPSQTLLSPDAYIPTGANTPSPGPVLTVLNTGVLFKWKPGTQPEQLGRSVDGAASYAIAPGGKAWAVGYQNGSIRFRDRTGTDRVLRGSQDNSREATWIKAMAFSKDGKHLIAGDWGGQIYQLDPSRGLVGSIHVSSARINGVATDPNGDGFATASDDGVRLWPADAAEPDGYLTDHGSLVTWVTYSNDGLYIATAGADNTVRVRRRSNDKTERILPTPDYPEAVAFSDDGRILAIAADDGLSLWDWKRGVRLVQLSSAPSFDVSLPARDQVAVVGSLRGSGRTFVAKYQCDVCIENADLMDLARSRSTRTLSPAESASFLAGISG